MRLATVVFLLLATWSSVAQISVDVSGFGVKVQTGKGDVTGNSVSIQSGTVESNVQMDGIAVINDDVFIDGEKVPKDRNSYKSKKTGKTYLIKRSRDGNVSVSEK